MLHERLKPAAVLNLSKSSEEKVIVETRFTVLYEGKLVDCSLLFF